MKRKLSSLLLALVLVLTLALPASAAFDSTTKNSVVVVSVCLDMDIGEVARGTGSGFFVGRPGENPTYLITNYHVISDFVDFMAGELFTTEVQGVQVSGRAKIRVYYDSKTYEEAYPVEYNETKDVAVLKLAGPTSYRTPIALRSPSADMVGSSVYAVGYPGISENHLAAATSSWSINDVSVTSGTISRILTTQGTGQVNLQIDCDIRGGNSGGPLVNEAGEVVGINTWSAVSSEDRLNYAVSIDEVIPILIANGVPYVHNASGDQVDPDAPAVPAVVEQPKDNTALIIAAVAGVAVIAGVAVFFILRSRKKPAPAAAPAPAGGNMGAPASSRTPGVRSMAPQHGGMRVALQNQPILIGRSRSDCTITYAENTPGVSGRHCSLSWDGNAFVLTDLGSTYGTFLQNGQKLNSGVAYRLTPGSTFWLGDKQNVLRVDLE